MLWMILGVDGLDQEYANGITMDRRRSGYLGEVQHMKEILVVSEFDFPFPRFDILLKIGVVILQLQGFDVVNIIGLNPNLAQVRDLVMQVTHTRMYTRVQGFKSG